MFDVSTYQQKTPLSTLQKIKLDIDYIQHLQDSFAKALGCAAVTVNTTGYAVTRPSNRHNGCSYLTKRLAGVGDTEKDYYNAILGGREGEKKSGIYTCPHTGLKICVAPLFLNGRYLASLVLDQIRLDDMDFSLIEKKAMQARLPYTAARAIIEELPAIPAHRLRFLSYFLENMAACIMRLGNLEAELSDKTRQLTISEGALSIITGRREVLVSMLDAANSTDLHTGINKMLIVLAQYYGADRAYIGESHMDYPVHCWYQETGDTQRPFCIFYNMRPEEWNIIRDYYQVHTIYIKNIRTSSHPVYQNVDKIMVQNASKGTRTIVQGAIKRGQELYGVLTLENAQLDRFENNPSEHNTLKYFCQIIGNVLLQKNAQMQLQSSSDHAMRVLNTMKFGILVLDPDTRTVLFANDNCQPDGKNGNALIGQAEERLQHPVFSLLEKTTYWEKYNAGENRWYQGNCSKVKWLDGRPVELYTFSDITEQKISKIKAEHIAYYDRLLDIPNRYKLEEDLHKIIAAGHKGAIVLLGVDDLRKINEAYGYAVGDAVLWHMRDFLCGMPALVDCVYRFAGDEFLLLLKNDSLSVLDDICRQVTLRFNKAWTVDGRNIYAQACLGIVSFPENGTYVSELLRKAEITLASVQKHENMRQLHFSHALEENISKRQYMENLLRSAVHEEFNGFSIHYQPLVFAQNGAWRTVEALCRWNSKELGSVSPAVFIPMAEQTSLIDDITYWILENVAKEMTVNGFTLYPNFRAAVNIPASLLYDENFVAKTMGILSRHGFPPQMLTLEITESIELFITDIIIERLAELKKIGVKIALDDFGTGYSSLYNLYKLPVNIIKTDRSFVWGIESNSYLRKFFTTMVSLSHAAGISFVAEGVETREQYQIVATEGVDLVQGYLFSKPIPLDELKSKQHLFSM